MRLVCTPSFHSPHHSNANLKKQVQRDSNKDESHQVGRCDDRCRQHDDDKRMFAVFGKDLCINDTQFTEEKCNDRQLEHQPHDQGQRDKCVDVGIQCDVAHHFRRYAISSQKSEGYWEEHKIAHQNAHNEQQVDDNSHLHRIFPFVFVQGRRYETKKLKQYVWRSTQQP